MGKKLEALKAGTKVALGKTVVGVGRATVKTGRAVREFRENVSGTIRDMETTRNDKYLKRARQEKWIGPDETNTLGEYLEYAEKDQRHDVPRPARVEPQYRHGDEHGRLHQEPSDAVRHGRPPFGVEKDAVTGLNEEKRHKDHKGHRRHYYQIYTKNLRSNVYHLQAIRL